MKQLPADSALVRSFTGGVEWGWDQEIGLSTIMLLHALIRIQLRKGGVKAHQIPPPPDIDRPWEMRDGIEPTKSRREATMEEAMTAVGGIFGRG